MQENKFNIELLPQGVFVITLDDGQIIRGRFSMYALNRFCKSKEITYFEAIGRITIGMTIEEYAELVVFALQDYYRMDFEQCRLGTDKWTSELVMDKIFEPLGFGNKTMLDFFKHAVGRLTEIIEPDSTSEEGGDKKKLKKTGKK